MIEFEINGISYKAGKLNAFQQLHVSRKLAPIVPKILPALIAIGSDKDDLSGMVEAFEPIAQGLSEMPDADCEFVFSTCFAVVSRQQNNTWSSIWNVPGKSMMFEDMNDLSVMSQLVYQVVKDSLGPFINGLLTKAQASNPIAA